MRSVESYIKATAPLVDMDESEVATLISLCENLRGYLSYEQLRQHDKQLTDNYDFVSNYTIGGSSDYGDDRPIGLIVIGDPDVSDDNAYLQGPEHACELGGATTIAVVEDLFTKKPHLLRRLGYSSLAASSHIDPDGMQLQSWPLEDATLKQYVKYGYRGSWSDQVSWGYPSENYHSVSPEVEASLSTIKTYKPRFVGSMHASNFAGYVVSSNSNQEMTTRVAEALEQSGLPINYDEPESVNDPVLAPGVFGTATSDSYKETRLNENCQPPNNIYDGGTNISQHLPEDTSLIIPEVPSIIADSTNDLSADMTPDEAVIYGAEQALTITARITTGLEELAKNEIITTAESQRLHRAASWWCDTVPAIFERQIQADRRDKSDTALTRSERTALIGTSITNSLIHAGNIQRLAQMANNTSLVGDMEYVIDDGLAILGPTRRVEIGLQIAVQVLTVLIGMKHADK